MVYFAPKLNEQIDLSDLKTTSLDTYPYEIQQEMNETDFTKIKFYVNYIKKIDAMLDSYNMPPKVSAIFKKYIFVKD